MSNTISSTSSSYATQMMSQAMQQRRDNLFSKIDGNGDGGIDKTELSSFTQKMSQDTGNSFNVDDIFSTYNKDGDSTLSKDELDTFMKDNPPPPPPGGGMEAMMGQMMSQSMQQRQDDLFSKVDSNSDGSIDTTEFSALTQKISENSGSTLNTEELFATYDANGDSTLSKDELGTFMKENPPPPPSGQAMRQAMSAYGASDGKDQISSLLDLLESQAEKSQSGSSDGTTSTSSSDFMAKLIAMLKNMASGQDSSSASNLSMLNVTA